ncbi:MAG TPA: hypothetical protein VKB03_08040 [Conexibacter sp.]|nr:hypothetical protein [Conexibacter sp.]
MSRRWFVSSVGVGAAAEATEVSEGRPALRRTLRVTRALGAAVDLDFPVRGPLIRLLGPGDVRGFERSPVVREEPPGGQANASAENLACVELADASLPWQLSRPSPDGRSLPWLVLLVLREDEGRVVPGDPPTIDVPGAALPNLADSWAWAHVEARTADNAASPDEDVVRDVRDGSQTVVARLLCPRRLAPDSGWIACVVPSTKAGVAAGLGRALERGRPFEQAWSAGQARAVKLPVYHWWSFRTGPAGSFEQLARLVNPVRAAALPGFGARTVSVRQPWPHERPPAEPASVTLSIQGALRVPGTEVADETWSDGALQQGFVRRLRERLDAPAERFGAVRPEADPADLALAPPLYGSHFAGVQRVPQDGWVATLNLQVRHRIAAALGTRYVQQEQEFLMARAWEQLGAIREANRLLTVGELSTETAQLAQDKHLPGMEASEVAQLAAPIDEDVQMPVVGTLARAFAQSGVPGGAAWPAFRRLSRPGGGLARRAERVQAVLGEGMPQQASVIAEGLGGGRRLLPEAVDAVTAQTEDQRPLFVGADVASLSSSQALLGLLAGQQTLLADHGDEMRARLTALTGAATLTMGSTAVTTGAPSPRRLRSLRRVANAQPLVALPAFGAALSVDVGEVKQAVVSGLRPLRQQLTRVQTRIAATDVEQRDSGDARPLRRIMEHPRFGMPIAAELLRRWPEWAVPGISGFPANSATLLETNSPFVEALLVGLNQETNRELLWREFPTDQRGSCFTRFWPSEVDDPDVDEIARWSLDAPLGAHDETGGRDPLVLLVRAEVLRRFPGTTMHAAKSVDGFLPPPGDQWRDPRFVLAVDEQTSLYAFEIDEQQARGERWLFVLREPMRGVQFGYDGGAAASPLTRWADLTWEQVPCDARGFVLPSAGDAPQLSGAPAGPDPPVWGRDAADMARIAFNQPFQVAFSPNRMLGPR